MIKLIHFLMIAKCQDILWCCMKTPFLISISHLNYAKRSSSLDDRERLSCCTHNCSQLLTTALTNIETCKTGVVALNTHQHNFMVPSNVTKMIGNGLVINKHFMKHDKASSDDKNNYTTETETTITSKHLIITMLLTIVMT